MNHWTAEQDKRQLEMWSDKHPVLSGIVTLTVAPIYMLVIAGGLVCVVCKCAYDWLPFWLRQVFLFWIILAVVLFCFYWLLYSGLWACGYILAR